MAAPAEGGGTVSDEGALVVEAIGRWLVARRPGVFVALESLAGCAVRCDDFAGHRKPTIGRLCSRLRSCVAPAGRRHRRSHCGVKTGPDVMTAASPVIC